MLLKKCIKSQYYRRVIFCSSSSSSSITEPEEEYAFEMASSTVRVGRGVTKEIGHDLLCMGLKTNICVVTDKNLAFLPPVKQVLDSLTACGIQYDVFDDVTVEPTDESLMVAINYCKQRQFKGFVAVGGGSVIDTAKAANL
jgi:hydroxyacid-oxoacid transhydrogenase